MYFQNQKYPVYSTRVLNTHDVLVEVAREVGPRVGEETVDFLSTLPGERFRLVQTVAVDDKVDERRAFVVGQLVHCPGTIANMAVTENEKKQLSHMVRSLIQIEKQVFV